MLRTIIAPLLVLGSAVLQQIAAVQRWTSAAPAEGERSIEDHLFDYVFPADPWVPVGAAAELAGVAYLLLACGVGFVVFAGGRRCPIGSLAAVPVIGWFLYVGGHALLSGILGVPSALFNPAVAVGLGTLAVAGLVVLAAAVGRRSSATAVAFILLLGLTWPGYVVAAFVIAPVVAGYQSYDTTPWTESIGAAATAAAGVGLLFSALLKKNTDIPLSRAAGRVDS
ncbi:hypothetical protein ABC304_16245 [Microbacterium sp. 1P10UB]|uniref:hypothetical protein n=1 Tax=unclassified Microbacterium TaxID=2609290 RepID=UPI0039A10F8E